MSLNHSQTAFYMAGLGCRTVADPVGTAPTPSTALTGLTDWFWYPSVQARPDSSHKHKSIVNHSTDASMRRPDVACCTLHVARCRFGCSGTQFALHFSISWYAQWQLQRRQRTLSTDWHRHRHRAQSVSGHVWLTVACNYPNANLVLIRVDMMYWERTVTSVKMIVDSRVRICGLILAYFVTCRVESSRVESSSVV